MFGLGPTELILIAVIILFLFGAKRIPEIGKGLGGVIREFRNVKKELRDVDIHEEIENDAEGRIEKGPGVIEKQVTKKMIDNVPAVKKANEINDKVNKIKDIMK